MLRSILFPLDATEASDYAGETAIQLSKKFDEKGTPIHLSALGVVDRPGIERPEPTPMGAGGFKEKRDHTLLADAREKISNSLKNYEARCKKAGVECEFLQREGDPEEQITDAALIHDAIVVGKETNFHFETSESTGETVGNLIRNHPRPTLLTPTKAPAGGNTLIAYDASIACSHSLHFWLLLGLPLIGGEVHIVSVDKDHERATGLCEEARSFLATHDVQAKVHPVESSDVVSSLLEVAGKVAAGTMVMGAYGTSGLKAAFFGSSTKKLIEASPYTLFIS